MMSRGFAFTPAGRAFGALARAGLVARLIMDHLPWHSTRKLARQLIGRANLARDTNRFEIAAWLYEEALRFTPGQPRIHVQCGHAYKEAGNFPAAELHYGEALRLLPHDADLALQLGHFYKLTSRHDEAEASYERALQLSPDSADAARELNGIRRDLDRSADAAGSGEGVVRELLPRPRSGVIFRAEQIEMLRFALRRTPYQGGVMKMLSGVEAIRGFAMSASSLTEVEVLLDGHAIIRARLAASPTRGAAAQRKYVFNIWHDFTGVAPGAYRFELRTTGPNGRGPSYRDKVLVAQSAVGPGDEHSDAFVPPPLANDRSIDEEINARASMVRSAIRSVLPPDIRTILVQRPDQLGDLVCSVPAIRRLRELFPGAKLVGLLTTANADLGRSLGLFDDIVLADFAEHPDAGRRSMTASAQNQLRHALEPYRFDLAIDLCEVSDSRPLLLLSNARFLYGFKSNGRSPLSADFGMHARDPVNGLETISPTRKILALVESLGALRPGIAAAAPEPDLRRERLAAYGINPSDRFIILHTGARLTYTRWPGFSALAALLIERTDFKIILMQDQPEDAGDLPQSDRLRVLTGRLPFEDFNTLLCLCSAMVGNDSGIKHLAALRGTPTVSLHMARLNWSEWGQENSGTIISRRVPCAGCALHHNAEDCGQDFACIRFIRPDEVFGAVMDLIDNKTIGTLDNAL